MSERVVDLLKAVEADDEQRHLVVFGFGARKHCREPGVERVAVGEAGQRIVFGEIADLLGLAPAHRDVAQDRAVLIALGALPAGETRLDWKDLAVAAASVELDHRAGLRGERHRGSKMRPRHRLTAQIASKGWPIISSG